MDVTNDNFIELLPKIKEVIIDCDFVAFDTELSGINHKPLNTRYDLHSERFARIVLNTSKYRIIQFGLSCFKRLEGFTYSNQTYNFYIFHQPDPILNNSRTFSISTQSLSFLLTHKFDFNRLIKSGINDMSFREKKELNLKLKAAALERAKIYEELRVGRTPSFVGPKLNFQNCLTQVSTFVNNCILFDGSERLELTEWHQLHGRRTIVRLIESQPYIKNILIEYKDNEMNHHYPIIKVVSEEMRNQQLKDSKTLDIGFLEVLKIIVSSKKPLVGHNILGDLIQVINQFIEPLEPDYTAFRSLCQDLFPITYDSKYIASTSEDTTSSHQLSLQNLYNELNKKDCFPGVKFLDPMHRFDSDEAAHEAGYDAFMTGCCFITLIIQRMQQHKGHVLKQFKTDSAYNVALDSSIKADYANKMYFPFSQYYKYFDLSREETSPDRTGVYYLECPELWGLNDIFGLFRAYGGVTAHFLDDGKAVLSLRNITYRFEVDSMAKESLTGLKSYKLYPISHYVQGLNSSKSRGDSP